MAVGDLILTNTSLTPEDLDKIAAEVEKDLAANAKEPNEFEEIQSIADLTSLPALQLQGGVYKLVRVAVSLLKGLDGTNGVDGREVELQVSSTAIQWRYSGTTGWTDLIQLSELKGEKGDKGDTGDTGDKGDQIVLRKTSTAIQWKYDSEEDTAYRDLILLADIKGDKGDTGNTPILETVEVTNGETPSGTFTKTGDDESGNPKYKLSLVVQKGKDGQPPIFEQGTTTTVSPDTEASVEVVANGTSEEGNPKYILNFSIPKGRDGQDGQGSGNVYIEPTGLLASKKYLFQPSQNNSANGTFVEYVEPNNFPDAPDDGKTYGRNNGAWVETSQMDEAPSDGNAYARKNKGWAKVIEATETALLGNYVKSDSYTAIEPMDSINSAIGKLEAGLNDLSSSGASEEYYYFPSTMFDLDGTKTSEEIDIAIGGADKKTEIKTALSNGKKFYISHNANYGDVPVLVSTTLGILFNIAFIKPSNSGAEFVEISFSTYSSIKVTKINGYYISDRINTLTSDSTTDDISLIFGSLTSLKKMFTQIKSGNKFYTKIKNDENAASVMPLSITIVKEESKYNIFVSGVAGEGFGAFFNIGHLLVTYDIASNTYTCQRFNNSIS